MATNCDNIFRAVVHQMSQYPRACMLKCLVKFEPAASSFSRVYLNSNSTLIITMPPVITPAVISAAARRAIAYPEPPSNPPTLRDVTMGLHLAADLLASHSELLWFADSLWHTHVHTFRD